MIFKSHPEIHSLLREAVSCSSYSTSQTVNSSGEFRFPMIFCIKGVLKGQNNNNNFSPFTSAIVWLYKVLILYSRRLRLERKRKKKRSSTSLHSKLSQWTSELHISLAELLHSRRQRPSSQCSGGGPVLQSPPHDQGHCGKLEWTWLGYGIQDFCQTSI